MSQVNPMPGSCRSFSSKAQWVRAQMGSKLIKWVQIPFNLFVDQFPHETIVWHMEGCKGMRTYPNIISFHKGLLPIAISESPVWATGSQKLSRYLPNFNFQSVCVCMFVWARRCWRQYRVCFHKTLRRK